MQLPYILRLALEILHGRSVLLLVLQCSEVCCGVKGQHACAIEIMALAERLGQVADEKSRPNEKFVFQVRGAAHNVCMNIIMHGGVILVSFSFFRNESAILSASADGTVKIFAI